MRDLNLQENIIKANWSIVQSQLKLGFDPQSTVQTVHLYSQMPTNSIHKAKHKIRKCLRGLAIINRLVAMVTIFQMGKSDPLRHFPLQ